MLSEPEILRYSRQIILLLFDGLGLTFREVPIRRDPCCPGCGEPEFHRPLRDEAGAPWGGDQAEIASCTRGGDTGLRRVCPADQTDGGKFGSQ